MKRTVIIIMLTLLVIIGSAGCIKPDESPIYNKNDVETFEDAVSSGKYQAPEHWTDIIVYYTLAVVTDTDGVVPDGDQSLATVDMYSTVPDEDQNLETVVIYSTEVVPDDDQSLATVETYSAEMGGITVIVDADIVVPDVDQFPVTVITEEDEISQKMVDRIRTALVGDVVLYDQPYIFTKTEIRQKIDNYRKILADPEDTTFIPKGTPEFEEYLANIQEAIKYLEELYKESPETEAGTLELKPADTQLRHDKNAWLHYENRNAAYEDLPLVVTGAATLDDGRRADMIITGKSPWSSSGVVFHATPSDIEDSSFDTARYGVPAVDAGLTMAQAREKAISAVQEMGIDYLDVSFVEEQSIIERDTDGQAIAIRPCYKFILMRNIGGITENYAVPRYILPPEFFTDGYSGVNKFHESAEIIIAEEGVISLIWGLPTKTGATISENVELLKFEDIQGIFNKQIIMDNVRYEMDMAFETNGFIVEGRKIVIDEARLGLMCVSRQGHDGESLMIPVWDFYGSEYIKLQNPYEANKMGFETNSDDEYVTDSLGKSYLTLNAMDGSVINRALGY